MDYTERVLEVKNTVNRGEDLSWLDDKRLQECFNWCFIRDKVKVARVIGEFLGPRLIIDESIFQQQCLCEMYGVVLWLILKGKVKGWRVRKWAGLEDEENFERREKEFERMRKDCEEKGELKNKEL